MGLKIEVDVLDAAHFPANRDSCQSRVESIHTARLYIVAFPKETILVHVDGSHTDIELRVKLKRGENSQIQKMEVFKCFGIVSRLLLADIRLPGVGVEIRLVSNFLQ